MSSPLSLETLTTGDARTVITVEFDGHVDLHAQLRSDVRDGLARRPRTIPPRWFYDADGSKLFDRITELDEYYPTRTERSILTRSAADIVAAADADVLVELGSGGSDKAIRLLDAMRDRDRLTAFVPFDVSADALAEIVASTAERYPTSDVVGCVGDFDHHLGLVPRSGRRLVAFLGGTIGNFRPAPRREFLTAIGETMDGDDHFLLGTDMVKDPARLVAAYDDAEGVTAEFNLNMLRVLNRELGGDARLEDFAHRAVWNVDEEWIEMHLVARRSTSFTLAELDETVELEAGEHLLTEISAKFTPERIRADLAAAGMHVVDHWSDDGDDFRLTLATRSSGSH